MSLFGNEEKFKKTRRTLDALGYNHSFGPESLNLVNTLLEDYLRFKHKFNAIISKNKTCPEQPKDDNAVIIASYQHENGRLQDDINKLHDAMLQNEHDSLKTVQDLKETIRSLQIQNANLSYSNSMYGEKVRNMDKEICKKNELLLSVQLSNAQATVSTGVKQQQQQQQRMDMTSMLKKRAPHHSPNLLKPPVANKYIVDMLNIADKKVNELELANEALDAKCAHNAKQLAKSNQMLLCRDNEVKRLQDIVSQGLAPDQVVLSAERHSYQTKIKHLNNQLNLLQSKYANNKSHKTEEKRHDSGHKAIDDQRLQSMLTSLKSMDNTPSDHVIKQLLHNEKELVKEIDRLGQLLNDDGQRKSIANVNARSTPNIEVEPSATIDSVIKQQPETDSQMNKRCNALLLDNQNLSAKVSQLDDQLELLHCDARHLRHQIQSKDNMIDKLTAQNVTLDEDKRLLNFNDRLTFKEAECGKLESQLKSYKSVVRSLEKQMSECNAQLKQSHAQLKDLLEQPQHAAVDDIHIKEMDQLRQENDQLTSSLLKMDEEKDGIQKVVDAKTELVVDLQHKLCAKQKEIGLLKNCVEWLESEASQPNDVVKDLHKQLLLLRSQLEEVTQANGQLEMVNNKLAHDLESVSTEYRVANEQVKRCKEQMHEYVTHIQSIEQLLIVKEEERNDLLQQYSNVSHQANVLKTQVSHFQTHSNNDNMEIFADDTENKFLYDTIMRLERELDEQQGSNHEYETEIVSLSHSLQSTESELELLQADYDKITADLQMERDLTTTLKLAKAELIAQLADITYKLEQSSRKLSEAEKRTEQLEEQVTSKESIICTLEGLLTSKQELEYKAEMQTDKLAQQIHLLQDKLSEAEIRISNQSKDLCVYQGRAAKLDADTDSLKRRLLNERFEREKAVQQLLNLQNSKSTESEQPQPLQTNSPLIILHTVDNTSITLNPQQDQPSNKSQQIGDSSSSSSQSCKATDNVPIDKLPTNGTTSPPSTLKKGSRLVNAFRIKKRLPSLSPSSSSSSSKAESKSSGHSSNKSSNGPVAS